MSIAVFPPSKTAPPPDALRSQLSESAQQELNSLRATLEAKLSELEAALTNPDQCESLEHLVFDLARLAADEAAATSRRAVLDVQLTSQTQIDAIRSEAQVALKAERGASAALRRELDEAHPAVLPHEQAVGNGAVKVGVEVGRGGW